MSVACGADGSNSLRNEKRYCKGVTMVRKSLIIYASYTGNTEKIALSFEKAFEKKGWQCDVFKVDKDTDFGKLPFDYKNYDFLCIGTPNIFKCPSDEIKKVFMPVHTTPPPTNTPAPETSTPVDPIKFGPDDKKGVIFATYAGIYLGPKEVEPVLSFMSVMMEWNLRFECVGRFSCPGKYARHTGWYKELDQRPSERDLQKAEIFMEEIIEDNYLHG
jgi:flavodoxin